MPDLYNAAKPRMYYIGGLVFIFLGVLDIWIFYFNPLQVNIFLDQKQKNLLGFEHHSANLDIHITSNRACPSMRAKNEHLLSKGR